MSSYVSVKVSEEEYKHFKVDKNVKKYIMQLESAIRTENFDVIRELYPRLKKK